jgi:peptidoglycan/LPS O-acetylase OafA/YrhL
MRYRPEIDGLRAISVIPVILFHAGFGIFSGGYVGVDIFFVISGYLITTLIVTDLSAGKFSLLNFYERRARRILPALIFVVALCIPFAWMWLLPINMQDFSQSLIATSLFSSNILFWYESGYFDAGSTTKPLLHTWSLAVEEQFYILFPLFLMLVWRFGKRLVVVTLFVVFVVSLVTANWAAYNNQIFANFYFLPTRGWEILIGSLGALYLNHYKTDQLSQPLNEVISLVGLLMIVYAIFSFDSSTPFPSFFTLVPTVGALFLIICANRGTIVHRFLSYKVITGFGLISYSAYLWHHPLYAFAKYLTLSEPSMLLMGLLSVSVIPLAYLSWRYVEQPFRQKKLLKRRFVNSLFGVAFTFFIAIGLYGHYSEGFKFRFDENELSVVSPEYSYELKGKCYLFKDEHVAFDEKYCTSANSSESINYVLLGDSHAASLYPELKRELKIRGVKLHLLSYSVCMTLIGHEQALQQKNKNYFLDRHITERCKKIKSQIEEILSKNQFDKIIILTNYTDMSSKYTVKSPYYAGYKEDYMNAIVRLKKYSNVHILGILPLWPAGLPQLLGIESSRSDEIPNKSNKGLYHGIFKIDSALQESAKKCKVQFTSILDVMCSEKKCARYVDSEGKRMALTYDSAHLSTAGASFIAKRISDDLMMMPIIK